MDFTRDFSHISAADNQLAGGKGANLGEMTAAGLPVPSGFCVTVHGFRQFMQTSPAFAGYLEQLVPLGADDLEAVREIGAALRAHGRTLPVPPDVAAAVRAAWRRHGRDHFYAVRSSATAEDLPAASFAGQQDTFLHIRGEAELLTAVRDCWLSLFTDRAILYRAKNQFDHRRVYLAVLVQRMVQPQVSGTLFTADPASGHRGLLTIDASFGLGEALVAGLVTPDAYQVDKARLEIVRREVADKQIAIRPLPGGGTVREKLGRKQRRARALLDGEILRLARLGMQIEAHYGRPQDIEWALADNRFYVLQSRPITTLYPLPGPDPLPGPRVFISASHAQVMTAPITPAGLSVWRVLLPFGRADRNAGINRYVQYAGGRVYIDISPMFYTRLGRRLLPRFITVADALMGNGLAGKGQRPGFAAAAAQIPDRVNGAAMRRWLQPLVRRALANLWFSNPQRARQRLELHIRRAVGRMTALQQERDAARRLAAQYAFIQAAFAQEALYIAPFIMTAMMSRALLERLLREQADPADLAAIQAGLTGNVTTEMDLMLGDLADLAAAAPAVAAVIKEGAPETILARLRRTTGSGPFLDGLAQFLNWFGMRGPGEIDIGRPRWRDDPTPLLMMVRGNLAGDSKGLHRRHFAQKQEEAKRAAARLVAQAGNGSVGRLKQRLVRRLITVFRAYMPLREHPKYMLVQMFQMLRETIRAQGERWGEDGRLDRPEDVWFLHIPEIQQALADPELDCRELVSRRRAAYERYERLVPPRVMTAAGEQISGRYSTDGLPSGAIPGSGVSAGVVEGVARVVLDPAVEALEPGEILVAPYTDPAWTPLFINAAGLVLEVGGLMTHGSVVAREYGIPAVVNVPGATQQIRTGQRIRVHGDRGFVELLE